VLAAEAEKAGLACDTAWQLVQLAERVVEFRAATGGQPVPLADWRAWLSLFLAGALDTPGCWSSFLRMCVRSLRSSAVASHQDSALTVVAHFSQSVPR
jgi:hypothetical protein